MQIDWASSLDLHVELEPRGGRRGAARARASAPRSASGRLRPGDRLPVDASAGARPRPRPRHRGRGLRAARRRGVPDARGRARRRASRPGRRARRPRASTRRRRAPPPRVRPAGRACPTSARSRARRGCARCAARSRPRPTRRSATATRAGGPELRAALAGYLGRTRGVLADPERIVVCSRLHAGPRAALPARCARRACARSRWRIRACTSTARSRPPRACAIRAAARSTTTARGRRAGRRRRRRRHAGAPVPARRRRSRPTAAPALVPGRARTAPSWSRTTTTASSATTASRSGALQGLDPEHVVYAGTASKTLAPGLRLGWLVLPRRLLEPVVEAKTVAGDTQALEQLALAELLELGRLRPARAPDAPALPPPARPAARPARAPARPRSARAGSPPGCTCALDVPDEAALVAHAAERSLALQRPRPVLARAARGPQGVVLGYAAPPEHAYGRTLATLADALRASGAAG